MRYWLGAISSALVAYLAISGSQAQVPKGTIIKGGVMNPAPTAKDYADLAKLPDWSGVWDPKTSDQNAQIRSNPPPWNAKAQAEVRKMFDEFRAGKPRPIVVNCLPHGMPSWMLITHNPMEILFTPGRVTMLGDGDGNRMRRIYTDGRGHREEPDPTFHGHSIGHWEGDTLVVDTNDILPQSFIAISEAVGVPNNGDMHIRERIHLADKEILHDDLEITAPQILTKPWKTTRIWARQRARRLDIVEGVCLQGSFVEKVDANGYAIFVPEERSPYGNLIAPD